jgi:Holliday junction resolvase-like predicted endonuclease
VEVIKSTRHAKITGDFAEALVLYWLSKYGFECAKVDHTGMDLIAKNSVTDELMGISVKARSRSTGAEDTYIKIERANITKLTSACGAFGCTPHLAIVIDAGTTIRCLITPMEHLVELSADRKHLGLPMRRRDLDKYEADPKMIVFQFESKTIRWWAK